MAATRGIHAILDAPEHKGRSFERGQARIEREIEGLSAREVLRPYERRVRNDRGVETRGVASFDQGVGQSSAIENEVLAQEGLAFFAGRTFAGVIIEQMQETLR